MTKRIGEHVFKRNSEDGFDITTMQGVDAMETIFDLFGIDIFDWCNDMVAKGRVAQAMILERLQVPPDGEAPKTRGEILANWFKDGDYCDGPEFLDRFLNMLNSVSGKNYHEIYAGMMGDKPTQKKASKKTP